MSFSNIFYVVCKNFTIKHNKLLAFIINKRYNLNINSSFKINATIKNFISLLYHKMEVNKIRLRFVQLSKNLWSDPRIRKLQEPDNGSKILVIYLKMLTESITNNGIIIYDPAFTTIGEQLSFALGDETEANIMMTLTYCIGLRLIKIEENSKFIFNDFGALTSSTKKIKNKSENRKELSQTPAAIKQRAYRARLKLKKQNKFLYGRQN